VPTRLLASLFTLLLSIGCERKSALEQAAEQDEIDAPVQHVYAKLPGAAEVPPGISKALWADVGWFPGSTYELTSIRSDLAFVNWLRDSLREGTPDCADVADGIDRYYMVRAGEPSESQTLVFYGTVDRLRVEACARRFGASMEFSDIRTDGAMLLIGSGPEQQVVAWAQRNGETIVIYAPSYAHAREFLEPPTTLVSNVAMVALLREPPLEGENLTLGLEDQGSVLLGVPSTGFKYDMKLVLPSKRMSFAGKLLFASEPEATKAGASAQSIARELADVGVEVEVRKTQVDQRALIFDFSIPTEWMADPNKAKAVRDMIERRRAVAGLGSAPQTP
jgi:hypothetical protein